MAELEGSFRLRNAKDLLRCGFYRPPLGDRIRLLAAMDEMGSLIGSNHLEVGAETLVMPFDLGLATGVKQGV
ncbi:hypothetical protein OIU34_08540 [Pararhizobium sp. BT-229]|uniref:hypothetical protein n=1 Tax=Pararhizobium sp. BT-229 TaxID=2986923 RepID=UPI0021F7234D|nr:hypothetical protein [Pararhizobium sp. BT-229]MCV9961948.1 hypothetical protein [Pararhizobium sp. BT-229]